ncbi:MAG: MATE family efflux transporter [Lachnospiraceae bacterium]|nr:MATE family efflux transporter [Lachnospiraceae bacterium]
MLTKDKSFYKSFLILTVTLMLEQAVVLSVNLADNLMLGNYSETALAGVAAVNQIQFILQQMVFAISNGMIVLGSQYWGQLKKEPIHKLISIGFWSALVIILLLFSYVSLFPHIAVGIFTNDRAIVAEGMSYLSIVRFSYPFFAITTVLLGGLRCVEKVKIALYVSVAALFVNCSINYVLIYGHFGFPEMGARGAAVGTLTARILECTIVALYLFCGDDVLHFRPWELFSIDLSLLKDYVKVSTPILITGLIWGCNTAMQTVVLGHLSSNAIAAHSISSTIFLFLKVTSVGCSSAASILIGKAVGQNRLDKVKEYTRTLQVLFLCVGSTLGCTMLLIRRPFLSLYAISDQTYQLTLQFMIVEAFVLLCTSYQMCMNTGVIRGGGDTRFVMIMDAFVIWGIEIPLALLTAFVWKASPLIVFMMLNCDQIIKCVPAFLYGNSYRWVRKLTK